MQETFELKTINASSGKVFRRKIDGVILGKTVYLGYMYYINNKKITEPILATADMFEEVDEGGIV